MFARRSLAFYRNRTMLTRTLIVVACALVPLDIGVRAFDTPSAQTQAVAPSTLRWRTCPEGPPFQCASLRVPQDHALAGGPTIDIAVLRVRARKPGLRIGSLLVNPGGPGVSARSFARQASRLLPTRITDRFDIVGFDPRGVGGSQPVRCLTDRQEEKFLSVDPNPDSHAEATTLRNLAIEFARACTRRHGAYLGRISTDDVVADMELLRQALGETQISYAGFSYGTMLGVLYADRYPDRVRAFVLDGMLDPTASAEERNRAQALGFERALDEFLDECAGRSACKLRGAGGAREVFDTLMVAVDRKPLAVGTRSVGPAESITAVVAALYNRETGWARLETALDRARKGDGKGLLAIADEYVDRSSTGRYADTNDANLAINCVDAPSPRDAPSYDAMAARLATEAPLFGPVTAYFGLPCAYWSVASPPSRALPRAEGSAPILVIGTTGDPATPLAWAKRVASSLDNGRLLVLEGEGHTAYIGGPRCITRAVEDYLVTLRVPVSGTKCRR